MNKQKDKKQHSLRLAVAAATLGMSMGVNPSVVLAGPDTGVAHKSSQVAAATVDYGKIDHKAGSTMGVKPGTAFPKVEQPGVQFPKVEQPVKRR